MNRSDETTPFFNVIVPTHEETIDWLLTSFVVGRKPVQAHKDKLGRQSYCLVGSRRYHVWESKLWRVYVHNEGGISLEVPTKCTPYCARSAIADYRAKMGVTREKIEQMRIRMMSGSESE